MKFTYQWFECDKKQSSAEKYIKIEQTPEMRNFGHRPRLG
jgi:hypothetical protein